MLVVYPLYLVLATHCAAALVVVFFIGSASASGYIISVLPTWNQQFYHLFMSRGYSGLQIDLLLGSGVLL